MDMHAYGNPWTRSKQPTAAERAEELRIRSDELATKRTNLAADLGALVYEETKTNPRARQGREVLYDGIASIDREQAEIAEELKQLDARHRREDEPVPLYCPFCGKPVTAEAVFCPQCGTRLQQESHRVSAASLTGQLEEVELDEPDMDFEFLSAFAAKEAKATQPDRPERPAEHKTEADAEADAAAPSTRGEADDAAADAGKDAADADANDSPTAADAAAPQPAAETARPSAEEASETAAEADSEDAAADAGKQADAEDADEPHAVAEDATDADNVDADAAAAETAHGDEAPKSADESAASVDASGKTMIIAPVAQEIDRSEKLAAAAAATAAALAAAAENPAAAEKAAEHTFLDPGATRVLPALRPEMELLDPGATQVIPIIPAVRTEAASFESDATEVLPETVDDAPDFDGADATRFMPAVSEHYEPDPTPHSYRSF
ncbi:MAG: zinc ribbon domain-containing protein [Eggerthellaceae bacterium]|jgi:hypothetical protein